jgi:hypothetical protein
MSTWVYLDIPNDKLGNFCPISLEFLWIDNPVSICVECSAIFGHICLAEWFKICSESGKNFNCPTCYKTWTSFVIYT